MRQLRSIESGSQSEPTWRLTKRGRWLVVSLVAMFIALTGWAASIGSAQADPVPEPKRVLIVQPGQSLWQVARQVYPHQDRQTAVLQIMQENRLSSARVYAGQRLLVVDSYAAQ